MNQHHRDADFEDEEKVYLIKSCAAGISQCSWEQYSDCQQINTVWILERGIKWRALQG